MEGESFLQNERTHSDVTVIVVVVLGRPARRKNPVDQTQTIGGRT
jgi:hypothetical protein